MFVQRVVSDLSKPFIGPANLKGFERSYKLSDIRGLMPTCTCTAYVRMYFVKCTTHLKIIGDHTKISKLLVQFRLGPRNWGTMLRDFQWLAPVHLGEFSRRRQRMIFIRMKTKEWRVDYCWAISVIHYSSNRLIVSTRLIVSNWLHFWHYFYASPLLWFDLSKSFKICLLAKWLSICLNLLKHSIIFCYCTTTPFNTLWKDLKGRKIGLWYIPLW